MQSVIFTILVPGHAEFNLWLCNLCHDNANKGLQNLVSEFWYFASRFPQSYLRKFITKYLKQKKSNFETFIGSFTCNHSFYGIYNNYMTLISRRRRNCTAQNFVLWKCDQEILSFTVTHQGVFSSLASRANEQWPPERRAFKENTMCITTLQLNNSQRHLSLSHKELHKRRQSFFRNWRHFVSLCVSTRGGWPSLISQKEEGA